MRAFLGLVTILALYMSAGIGLLRTIIRRKSNRSECAAAPDFTEILPIAFGLSVGIIPLILFYINLIGIKINITSTLAILIPLSLLGLISVLSFFKTQAAANSGASQIKAQGTKRDILHELLMTILIAIVVILTFIKALDSPMRGFDDRATWSYLAKVLFYEGSVKTESFYDPARLNVGRGFPLSLPIIEATVHLAMGRFDELKVKIIFPLFLAATLLILFSAQRRFSSRKHALLFTLAYAAIPFLSISRVEEGGSADTGFADIPLSFFYTVSALYFYRWIASSRAASLDPAQKDTKTGPFVMLISSLFIASALFLKQDAMILFASWGAALIFISVYDRKRNSVGARTLLYMLVPIAVNLPFWLHAMTIPSYGLDYYSKFNPSGIFENLPRIPFMLAYAANTLLSFQWGFLGVPFLAALVLFRKNLRRGENLLLLWMIFTPLFGYFVPLLVTPADIYWQLVVAFDRLLLHVAPLMIFLMSAICRDDDK